MTGPLGEPPRPVGDFWRDGQPMPQQVRSSLTWPPEVSEWLDAEIVKLWNTSAPHPATPADGNPYNAVLDAMRRYDAVLADAPRPPRVVVVDERSWATLRRAMPAAPVGRLFGGVLGNMLDIPVVVRREPRRARPVRRTGPLVLVGRRARHAGMLRVARLQRRVDRHAARRAPRPAPAVFGVFR